MAVALITAVSVDTLTVAAVAQVGASLALVHIIGAMHSSVSGVSAVAGVFVDVLYAMSVHTRVAVTFINFRCECKSSVVSNARRVAGSA